MKVLHRFLVSYIALFCMCISVISVYAETYYNYYGYIYTIYNNTSISLAGWDGSSPDIIVPDSIENRYFISVSNRAFKDNTQIESIDFSETKHLKRIGMNAFTGCTGINKEIKMPSKLEVINDSAFMDCTSLPSIDLRSAVTSIPDQCFYGCSSLNSVTLPSKLKSINAIAFANCTSLKYLEIPSSVSFIDSSAFSNTSITLGVWYGTAGYDYAIAQNIPYILLDGVKLGDANGDGIVNINDVTAIQQHLADYVFLEGISLHAADADQNGEVKIDDATLLQEFLAEYTVGHPVGEVMTQ